MAGRAGGDLEVLRRLPNRRKDAQEPHNAGIGVCPFKYFEDFVHYTKMSPSLLLPPPLLFRLHAKEDGRWTTREETLARHPIIGGVKDERRGDVAPFAVVLGRSGGQQGSLRRRFRAKYRERAGGGGRGHNS